MKPAQSSQKNGITTYISPAKKIRIVHSSLAEKRKELPFTSIYSIAKAATAAAPRLKNDCEMRPDATLAVAWAGALLAVPLAPPLAPPMAEVLEPESLPDPEPLLELAPLPDEGEGGVLPAALEPGAWPGLRFCAAVAARATKACMVLLPDAGLLVFC